MRVLHAISGIDPENGGPTFALIGLAQAQARAGLDVTVMATWQIRSGFPLAEQMRSHGVKVEMIGQARGKLSRHPQLRAIVQRAVDSADVVHIHALWEEIQHQAARACQRSRVPYVVTPHGMLSPWSFDSGSWINRWGKRLYLALRLRRNLNCAAALHFTTTAERDLAKRLGFSPPAIVEPIGLDLHEFDPLPLRGAFRAKQPQVGSRPMMIFLGRLSPQKGLDILIAALAEFAARDTSGAVLVLAGPDYDGYSAAVNRMVDAHRLRDRVVFAGMLQGIQRIEALVDADLFVLPSRHENFGIAVAESMACGTPVLISRHVNLCDDVAKAGAGAVVEAQAPAFVAEMARWLADAGLRREAGQRGRQFALACYNWKDIAAHWANHYQGLSLPR